MPFLGKAMIDCNLWPMPYSLRKINCKSYLSYRISCLLFFTKNCWQITAAKISHKKAQTTSADQGVVCNFNTINNTIAFWIFCAIITHTSSHLLGLVCGLLVISCLSFIYYYILQTPSFRRDFYCKKSISLDSPSTREN